VGEIPVEDHGSERGRYSSNAFSWVMQARPAAICATGYWFWDDYAVEASVKPEERGAVGLLAYLKDANNYLLFRWTAAAAGRPQSGGAEIIRVLRGKCTTLASAPGGFQPKQWYRLRFTACEGALTAWVDGRQVCSARDDSFGQGKAGLFAQACGSAKFDDVRVLGTHAFTEGFAAIVPGEWEDHGAAWHTNVQARRRQMSTAGTGFTLCGEPDWRDYTLSAPVSPAGAPAVGRPAPRGTTPRLPVPAANSFRIPAIRLSISRPAAAAGQKGTRAM
jgi:hypothetical protein